VSKPAAFLDWPKTVLPVTFGPYRAVVDRWLDGDTWVAFVDMGMGEYVPKAIRLSSAGTPEMDTPEGRAAKAFSEHIQPPGSRQILRTEKDSFTPTFSRWAAGALMEDNRDLATVLVDSGHATWREE
jgi:endonuclease YncB( thermonuclease family)